MGLRRDRKGMIAMMDALIFIILISMAASWLFFFNEDVEHEEPLAKTVCDDLFTVEAKTCDLMYLGDTKILPLRTLIAATMSDGRTEKTETFISSALEELIPPLYGYEMSMGYNGHTLRFERLSERPLSSEYLTQYDIEGTGTLEICLRLY